MLTSTGKRARYDSRYWKSQITTRLENHDQFFNQAGESIKVYNTQRDYNAPGDDLDISRKRNIWWYCVDMLMPAYCPSTPKAEVELRKKLGSPSHQLAASIWESATQTGLEEFFDFPDLIKNLALHWMLTGRAIQWVDYKADVEDQNKKFSVLHDGEGGLVDQYGQPFFVSDDDIVKETKSGANIKRSIKVKTGETARIQFIQSRDYLQSDSRTNDEIEWRAKRAWMSQDQAENIFGKDVADKFTYNSFPESIKNEKNRDDRNQYDAKAELWEIHSQVKEKVYWMDLNGQKPIVESGDPELKFSDFYPCVTIDCSLDTDSTIPTSDYVHVRDQIIEVERLTSRKHAMIRSIRANQAYDSTLGDAIESLWQGDLKLVPIKNWPSYKQRGGLASAMEPLDIKPYVDALQVISQELAEAEDGLYQSLKVSDLLRGASDPTKTATANRLESGWSSLGLVTRQNMWAKFIGDGIGKFGTVIAQQFEPETIFELADAEQLLSQNPNINPAEIIEILKNDSDRCYRLKLSSDSMLALDEKQERADAADLLQSAGGFFQNMSSLIEQYPPLAQFSMQLMQYSIRRYKGGKELEPVFMQMLQAVSQIAAQKQAQQSQQPPDPAVIKSQTDMQIAQLKSQDDHHNSLIKLQQLQQDMILAREKQEFEATVELKKLDLEAQQIEVSIMQIQATTQLGSADLALKTQELQQKGQSTVLQAEIDKRMSDLNQFIEQQKVDIERIQATHQIALDKVNVQLSGMQHHLDVAKSAHEATMAKLELVQAAKAQTQEAQASPTPQKPPVVNVHIGGNKKITKNADGSYQSSDVEE